MRVLLLLSIAVAYSCAATLNENPGLGTESRPISYPYLTGIIDEPSSGSYSFVGDDGQTYIVIWRIDEKGLPTIGDHLAIPSPVPEYLARGISVNHPYIPEEILKSLLGDKYSKPATSLRSYYEDTPSSGSYSFTGDDGRLYTVTWQVKESGFRPKGPCVNNVPRTMALELGKSLFQNGYTSTPIVA